MVKLKKIEAIKKLKQAKLIKLSPENIRDYLDDEPGVYIIYNSPDPTQRPLYVGTTGRLAMRFNQLMGTIHFDHTFTWRLFWKEAERMSGRPHTKLEELYDRFWDGDKKGREKVVRKIERLLYDKLWFKYVELLGWEKYEREKFEEIIQKELNPLNPHLRDSKITLDDLLR